MLAGLVKHDRNVVLIESAQQHRAAFLQAGGVDLEVAHDYVAVDICKKQVDRLHTGECRSIAEHYIDFRVTVQRHVFDGIDMSKLINLYSRHGAGSAHGGKNGKDACAGTHVDYRTPLKRQLEKTEYYQRGGLMMSRAESHFGVDHNVVGH